MNDENMNNNESTNNVQPEVTNEQPVTTEQPQTNVQPQTTEQSGTTTSVEPTVQASSTVINPTPVAPAGVPPMGGMPMNGVAPQNKNNKSLLIVGVVVAVIVAIIVFIMVSGSSSKDIKGEWDCTGTSGNATIKLTDNEVSMTMTQSGVTVTISGDYSKYASKVKTSNNKSGYTYTQYKVSNAKYSVGGNEASLNQNYGFIFGMGKDDKKAHYIDSLSADALQYECTKK